MKIRIDKTFDKDVGNINDKKLLRKLRTFISAVENAENIHEIPHIKKITGYESFYRIKIRDFRLGLEMVSNNEVVFIRFLHRRDIYRYFPKV